MTTATVSVAGVHGACLQQGADLVQRGTVVPVGRAVDGDGARRRPAQTHDQAHGGRLPGTVRPEEAGDAPGLHVEAEALDSLHLAELLVQVADLDGSHARCMMNEPTLLSERVAAPARHSAPPAVASVGGVTAVPADTSGRVCWRQTATQ
jgi:hypothetical protein